MPTKKAPAQPLVCLPVIQSTKSEIVPKSDIERRFVESFINEQKPTTRSAYGQDLEQFAAFCGLSRWEACMRLAAMDAPQGHELVKNFLVSLRERCAPSTINRRLSALKSFLKTARIFGRCNWTLELRGAKAQQYRNTTGPTLEEMRRMIDAADKQKNRRKSCRDVAILRICFSEGLRRAETYGLDLKDFDLERGLVSIIGKGDKPDTLPLPSKTLAAIKTWVLIRGLCPGPMFPTLWAGDNGKGGRLSPKGFYKIIVTIGNLCGLKVHPHALRHATATTALEQGIPIRDVQKLMRHTDAKTTEIYDDNRKKMKGATAQTLDDLV